MFIEITTPVSSCATSCFDFYLLHYSTAILFVVYFFLITVGYFYFSIYRKNPKIEKIYKEIGIKDITRKQYDVIIVEDAKTGFQFFSKVGEILKTDCISAKGKSNILSKLSKQKVSRILIIADSADFGSEIHQLVSYMQTSNASIDLFLPESFEWLILKSDIFVNQGAIQEILSDPVEYIESSEYFSWERFFTQLLVSESEDMPNLEYPKNKSKLPSGYLMDANVKNIIHAME